MSEKTEAQVKLEAWHDSARWIAYVASEFIADQTTRCYLEHVASCVRDEGERRLAVAAGFRPALAG